MRRASDKKSIAMNEKNALYEGWLRVAARVSHIYDEWNPTILEYGL